MARRILHLANFNSTNVGNGALIWGTERLWREDLGTDLEFIPEPWDDYTFGLRHFDADFVERVNAGDVLLVGGAVIFNARSYLSNTGTRFDLPEPLWTAIRKPVIFYGISYRVWPRQRFYYLDRFRRFIATLLKQPNVLFGVRNDGTKSWLEQWLGWSSDRIVEMPDPGMFVPTEPRPHLELATDRPNLIFSLNNEDEAYRYGGRSRELLWAMLGNHLEEKTMLSMWRTLGPDLPTGKRRALDRLATAFGRICEQRKLNLIFCPHYFDDLKMFSELVVRLPARIPHQSIVSAGLSRVATAPGFYDLYAKADLAICMRVHSLSPALGIGLPAIALSSQPRLDDFMHNIGLDDLRVDFFDPDLTVKLPRLVERCLLEREPLRARLREINHGLRERIRQVNTRIADLINA